MAYQTAMLPRTRIMTFTRHHATWPWQKQSDALEEWTMDQVWTAVSPYPGSLSYIMRQLGGTERVETNPQTNLPGIHYNLPTRLITVSPDQCSMTVRHWQYRPNPLFHH